MASGYCAVLQVASARGSRSAPTSDGSSAITAPERRLRIVRRFAAAGGEAERRTARAASRAWTLARGCALRGSAPGWSGAYSSAIARLTRAMREVGSQLAAPGGRPRRRRRRIELLEQRDAAVVRAVRVLALLRPRRRSARRTHSASQRARDDREPAATHGLPDWATSALSLTASSATIVRRSAATARWSISRWPRGRPRRSSDLRPDLARTRAPRPNVRGSSLCEQ